MADDVRICSTCAGSGRNILGHPCGGCGGEGEVVVCEQCGKARPASLAGSYCRECRRRERAARLDRTRRELHRQRR